MSQSGGFRVGGETAEVTAGDVDIEQPFLHPGFKIHSDLPAKSRRVGQPGGNQEITAFAPADFDGIVPDVAHHLRNHFNLFRGSAFSPGDTLEQNREAIEVQFDSINVVIVEEFPDDGSEAFSRLRNREIKSGPRAVGRFVFRRTENPFRMLRLKRIEPGVPLIVHVVDPHSGKDLISVFPAVIDGQFQGIGSLLQQFRRQIPGSFQGTSAGMNLRHLGIGCQHVADAERHITYRIDLRSPEFVEHLPVKVLSSKRQIFGELGCVAAVVVDDHPPRPVQCVFPQLQPFRIGEDASFCATHGHSHKKDAGCRHQPE